MRGRTRLRNLFQDGAAKIRMPRSEHDPLEAILINTAGGLTGGDRLGWDIDIGAAASAVITTQASEKIYRAASGRAEVAVRLSVAAGGRLAWLPQETIMFDRAAFLRRLDVELAPGAEALIAEATVFGRTAMGERVERGIFRDRWRLAVAGRLVHAEEFAVGPLVHAVLAAPAVLGGARAMATVLLVSQRRRCLSRQGARDHRRGGRRQRMERRRDWQTSCEALQCRRLQAEKAPRAVARAAQRTGRHAEMLVTLGGKVESRRRGKRTSS